MVGLSLALHALLLLTVLVPEPQDEPETEWLTLNLEPPEPSLQASAPAMAPDPTSEPAPTAESEPTPDQTKLVTTDFDESKPLEEEFSDIPGAEIGRLEQVPPPQLPSRAQPTAPPEPPQRATQPPQETSPAEEPSRGEPEPTQLPKEPEMKAEPTPDPDEGLGLARLLREQNEARSPQRQRAVLDPRDPRFSLPRSIADPGAVYGPTAGDPFAFKVMNAEGYNIRPYAYAMKSRFRSNWHVPPITYTGASGAVSFELEIAKDGTILRIDDLETTGIEAYELAARRAVELSNRLPALPPDFPNETLIVRFGFLYNWRQR